MTYIIFMQVAVSMRGEVVSARTSLLPGKMELRPFWRRTWLKYLDFENNFKRKKTPFFKRQINISIAKSEPDGHLWAVVVLRSSNGCSYSSLERGLISHDNIP